MTEQDIQYALGQHLFLKNVCIPNVLMSGVKKAPYEADFIYFNLNKLHLTEVEIKTDINDFRNDFKKACYHDNHNVMYLYYAVPRSLYDDHWDVIDEMLGNAGLILIDEYSGTYFDKPVYKVGGFIKRAKRRKGSVKLNEKEKEYYMRIGCMKWVNR